MSRVTVGGVPGNDAERWASESEYFDGRAREAMASLAPMDPLVLERYRRPRRAIYSKEFRFQLAGDLAGKRVLDVGCGDGVNSITLARLGATVVGLDISPLSIEVARKRAEINGVADRATFVCEPLEKASFARQEFDIVWGDAVLHHLLPELDSVVAALARWTAPTGMLMFGEPLNLAPWLRRMRLSLPIDAHGTPDERPLEEGDLAIVRRHIPGLRIRHFSLFDRVNRFVLGGQGLERAPALRRGVALSLTWLDYATLSLVPPARRLAGRCVLWGSPAAR